MRLQKPQSKLLRPLLLVAATAALAFGMASEASAQRKGSGFGTGPRYTPPSPSVRPPTGPRPHGPQYPGPRDRGPNWGGVVGGAAVGVIIGAAIANANQPPPPPARFSPPPQRPRGNINIPPASERRFVPNEVVLEFAGNYSPQAIAALAARHRLARIDSVSFGLTNSTYFHGRISDGRPVRDVLRGLGGEATLRAGQPNYLYSFVQARPGTASSPAATFAPPPPQTPAATPVVASSGAMSAGGDPAQYTLTKLRLSEAHGLTRGDNVLVAVIDSGIDAGHPELAGVIAGTFDALDSSEKPHTHGTAIAGAIAARSRLMGVAPAARILAIRAFGASGNTASGTSFAILKSLEYAVAQNARVINMSFAGPADPAMARHLTLARGKGIVLIAAAGNFGPKSPAQYPAADPNVIAVSATDAEDKLFTASNRGNHIAIAAPGVDILLPAPEANYQVTSGTSFAAAHVSGIAALILERRPGLSPDNVRRILQISARDLGPRGKDDQYGAGLADAYQAILALEPRTATAPRPATAAR